MHLTLFRPFPARLQIALAMIAALALGGCAGNAPQQNGENRAASRMQALAAAVGMPEEDTFQVQNLAWQDDRRQRPVLARVYLPLKTDGAMPLVLFSHGIGGSREGYTYIGKYLAANGVAALHVQHAGSDRSVWSGNPLQMVGRLQDAAKESEAVDRTFDMRFALDQLLADRNLGRRVDVSRIAVAGHSYGANTAMLLSGAQVRRDGKALDLSDSRIRAAVIISAPPFYGEGHPADIVGRIRVPSLHITSTGDEINIPGYHSPALDRIAVYDATSSAPGKMLAVFKDGSHSMFTDRLGTGGDILNPLVKKATRELMLAFLNEQWRGDSRALAQWPQQHSAVVARFERQR